MRRSIYCPDNSLLEEAEKVSKFSNLPILIGDCQDSMNLQFDRTKVQVISIPDIYNLFYEKNVKKNFHQVISYYNDYKYFTKYIHLNISGVKVKPHILEKHFVKFIYTTDKLGHNTCSIIDQDVTEEIVFNVY